MYLTGNTGLTTLDSLSVLGTYTQLVSVQYTVGYNSKPTISGAVNFPASNQIQKVYVWAEYYTPSDWK